MEDALSKSRVPVLWSTFPDMDRESFLETQVLALGENLASSFEEEREEEEEAEKEEAEVEDGGKEEAEKEKEEP